MIPKPLNSPRSSNCFMVEIKIVHDKPTCIGCAACTAVAPEFWEMHDDKSHVKGSNAVQKDTGEWEELVIEEKDYQQNREAADVCPVNCIHIEKDKKREI